MHSMNNLKRLPQLKRLAANTTAKFWQYDQAALADGESAIAPRAGWRFARKAAEEASGPDQ